MRRYVRWVLIGLMVVIMGGCSDSGGTNTLDLKEQGVTQTNNLPEANITTDITHETVTVEAPNQAPEANITVTQGDAVTFDASHSSDSDGSITAYLWQEGNTTLSSDSNFTKADFAVGTHTVTLTVTDDDNATDTTSVTVTIEAPNQAPTADAGSNRTIYRGYTVTLHCGGSDADGTVSSYRWYRGTTEVATTQYYTTPSTLGVGTYTYTCEVSDDDGAKGSDSVRVAVVTPPPPPPPPNHSPTADAGSDRTISVGGTVALHCGGSDTDGTITRYRWYRGIIEVATTQNYTTPATLGAGSYTYTCEVTDDDAKGRDRGQVTMTTFPSSHIS